jgi:hypothetical protein
MSRHFKPFRHISNGAIIRTWSGARTDHRAEPEAAPAPRALHWRQRSGSWADQPRSNCDQQKKRAHLRRQQMQTRQQERAALLAQLKDQQ